MIGSTSSSTTASATSKSYATEIAIDAHAARLLRQNSPPEACIDSSLGPYVTSILRRSSLGNIANGDDNELIELLEGQCQMNRDNARDVLASIALAVQTGVVPISTSSDNAAKGSDNGSGDSGEKIMTRSRSKSLGAEPAAQQYEFLGKILQDAMTLPMPLPARVDPPKPFVDLSNTPTSNYPLMEDQFSSGGLMSNGYNNRRTKKRSVTFDDTYSTQHDTTYATAQLPNQEFWSSLTPFEEEHQLGGILGVLDLEEYDEKEERQTENAAVVVDKVEPLRIDLSHETANIIPTKRGDSDANGEKKSRTEELQSEAKHNILGNNLGDFPDLNTSANSNSITRTDAPKHQSRKGKKSSKREANDLAAALFRPSRPRSNSLMDQHHRPVTARPRSCSLALSSGRGSPLSSGSSSPKNALDFLSPSSTPFCHASGNNTPEMNSTIQLLLTLNSHLGHEAATLASQLADGDLNLAQHLIEAARSDPSSGSLGGRSQVRVCRHELRGTCYQADCQYSHDLRGVTCLFWLKGRCRGSNCRFLHGFEESMFEGICKEYDQSKKEENERRAEEEKNKIHTANLVQHNEWVAPTENVSSSSALVSNPAPLFGGCWTPSIVNQ